jgi:Fe-S oxidoreductase
MQRRGIKTLITSCSGCWLHLSRYYPLFAHRLNLKYDIGIRHITEVISQLSEEGRIKFESPIRLKVTYHDPCQIGRAGGILEPPRKILTSIPGLELVEMHHNKERTACCGRHATRYPRVGSAINRSRVAEAEQTGAQALVSCCPTCEDNFRAGIADVGAKLEVLDLSELVAETIGLPRLAVGKLAKLLHQSERGG